MPSCWAAILEGCAGGSSGEHLISANLFDGPRITVSGFPWCVGREVEIGLQSFTSNILCRRHNSALSDIDAAGGAAFRLLEEVVRRWREDLQTATTRRLRPTTYEFDGRMLEKWFAKSTVNLFCVNATDDMTWSIEGAPPKAPPRSIVRPIFGESDFPEPLGLYIARLADPTEPSAIVGFAPVYTYQDELVAGLFAFRGICFALWLHGERPDVRLLEHIPNWRVTQVLHHPSAIGYRAHGGVSRRLKFLWS